MSDRRKQPRLKSFGLSTPFGEVVDISDSGLGVFRKGKVEVAIGDTVAIHLSQEGLEADITARVARIDKIGLFRHEIGFEFIDIDDQTLINIWSMSDAASSEFCGPRCYIAA